MQGLTTMGISLESIVIYLAAYGVLFAILVKLLYKPINDYLTQRQTNVRMNLEEAERIKAEFQAKFEAIKAEKARIHAELSEQISNAQALVETKRLELLADMEAQRQLMMEKAQQEIQAQKDDLVAGVESKLTEVITKIIMEITYNQVPKDVIQRSVDHSWKEYKQQI